MDTVTIEQRSALMRKVKSSNTKPEICFRKAIHSLGLRYNLNNTKLPGKPDLVFSKHKSVVFVNGCFWHHHAGCKRASMPKSNLQFWKMKINNVKRDSLVREKLIISGWKVFVIWECELRKSVLRKNVEHIANEIRKVPHKT